MSLAMRVWFRGGAIVVALHGAVDTATLARQAEALRRLARRPRPFVLDLGGLTLLDADALRRLVSALKLAGAGRGRLAVVCGRSSGMCLLHRWRIAELAPLFRTVDAAVERHTGYVSPVTG